MKLTQEEKNLIEIDNQHWIDLDVSLQRLLQNPDFKKVILDGFMADRALDQVSLLAHDTIIAQGKRANVIEQLVAISHLRNYLFHIIPNMSGSARESSLALQGDK